MSRGRPPPALADWLLSRLVDDYRRDGLIGDLKEEFRRGRSRAWYWREALAAIAAGRHGRCQRRLALGALRVVMIAGLLVAAGYHWAWPLFIFALDPTVPLWLRRRRMRRADRARSEG